MMGTEVKTNVGSVEEQKKAAGYRQKLKCMATLMLLAAQFSTQSTVPTV